jgi:hypothetical protein
MNYLTYTLASQHQAELRQAARQARWACRHMRRHQFATARAVVR